MSGLCGAAGSDQTTGGQRRGAAGVARCTGLKVTNQDLGTSPPEFSS